jgi:pilus assembly protein CpaB
MRVIFGAVLLVGIALAGFAVHMAQSYVGKYQAALANERQARKPAIETVDIFVANASFKYGEKLDPAKVLKIKWPKNSLPAGIFDAKETLFPDENERPRYVLRAMEPGEPIMAVKVTAPGQDAGLTTRLAKGMRAFAIRVDVASGVSGFLRPGDRVDVYWTGSVEGAVRSEGNRDFTKLIQAGVDLIAIDQTANVEGVQGTIARTVTVAVRPQQVAALAQAQNTGRLSLSLVGALDETVAEAIEVDQSTLLGITREEKVVEVQEEKVCTIRTRRGAEVVEIPIPCSQ